jgi:hypothetical protein
LTAPPPWGAAGGEKRRSRGPWQETTTGMSPCGFDTIPDPGISGKWERCTLLHSCTLVYLVPAHWALILCLALGWLTQPYPEKPISVLVD